jgi:hypothetical protein
MAQEGGRGSNSCLSSSFDPFVRLRPKYGIQIEIKLRKGMLDEEKWLYRGIKRSKRKKPQIHLSKLYLVPTRVSGFAILNKKILINVFS